MTGMSTSTLANQKALVTGATSGIGRAIAVKLAEAGATVYVTGRRADLGKETVGLIEQAGGTGHFVVADLGDLGDVRALAGEVGEVDVLVNNAGIDKIERFVDSTPDTWRKIVDVNLLGTINMTRTVLDPMLERRSGRLVHIASDAGRVGSSGEVVYSATKGGVIAFAKGLAREVASKGVTSNVVCPGPTDTALLDQVAEASEKLYAGLAKAIPMRRIGQPADIAPAVAFLAGDGAGFVTGQTLSVSGGLTMS